MKVNVDEIYVRVVKRNTNKYALYSKDAFLEYCIEFEKEMKWFSKLKV